jgi:hypothetical protein
MRKIFKQIPEPLQKQIIFRLAWGLGVLLLTIILFIYTRDLFSMLSCIAIVIFCSVSTFQLFRRAVLGEYVVITGECTSIMFTTIRKRTKSITIRTNDNKILNVMIKQRVKKFSVGSNVKLYVAANVPLYENEGAHLLYSYLAIDM